MSAPSFQSVTFVFILPQTTSNFDREPLQSETKPFYIVAHSNKWIIREIKHPRWVQVVPLTPLWLDSSVPYYCFGAYQDHSAGAKENINYW